MSHFDMTVFVSSYCILFHHISLLSLKACSFLMRDTRGMDPDGRGVTKELEKVDRRETII